MMFRCTVQFLFVCLSAMTCVAGLAIGDDDLVLVQRGDLPILLSAPHGGTQPLPGVAARTGAGLKEGPSGFVTVRDTGTAELALQVADALEQEMAGRPWLVVSRVHRRYVDFNRPVAIAVECGEARAVYDVYHIALAEACREIRTQHGNGLLLDIHGQGTSASTVYRGTKNGLTVSALRSRSGPDAHTGSASLLGRLHRQGWKVHPSPFDQREQAGFTGGYIVQKWGSHRPQGIDAVQLEFGRDYRIPARRSEVARQLARAVADWTEQYIPGSSSLSEKP